ncbi:MAG TPA: EAL domain-containing protein [Caulobacteraceae bacterium]|nr:EAL domain-containing protein [Caulobacteraceae bacterium]
MTNNGIPRRRPIQGKLTLLVFAAVGGPVALVTGLAAWRGGAHPGDGPHLLSSLFGLGAGLTAALVSLAAAWLIQRKIAGQVAALAAAMRRVRENRDDGLAVDVRSDDDIGDLAIEFNEMLAEIRSRDASRAARLEGLEQALAERSRDLAATKVAAEHAERAANDVLATVGREIRTPLTGVMAMAERLAAGELSPGHHGLVDAIAKSGASLAAALDDILGAAKLGTGPLKLSAAPADPVELVEDVLALFWEPARSKGLDLAAYVDPATPSLVATDAARLRQMICHLVGNAIALTDAGAVMVQVGPAGGALRFAVRDSGAGVPRDQIASLLVPEAGSSTVRQGGGAGLGLAFTRRLAGAMGGSLTAASEVGRGSVFTLELPMKTLRPGEPWPKLAGSVTLDLSGPATRAVLQRYLRGSGLDVSEAAAEARLVVADASALKGAQRGPAPTICLREYGDAAPQALLRTGAADLVLAQPLRRRDLAAALERLAAGKPVAETRTASERSGMASPLSFAGARVLVADSGAVNREVALEMLSRLGVVPTLVADGRAAVDAVMETHFDLALLADEMPELDGFQAAAEIRRQEAQVVGGARTPIVALAPAADRSAERWRVAGMDGTLDKPFTLAGLEATLAQFLTVADPPATSPQPQPAMSTGPAPAATPPKPATATAGAAIASDLLDPQVTGELARMAAAGKGDFVARVRRLYRENAPTAVKALIEASTNQDAEGAARAAHALKSMSLNMGARLVAETSSRLEAQARDLSVVNVDQALVLHRQLLATLDVLEGYPPDLRPPDALVAGAAPDEQSLLEDLSAAIDRDELALVYQPQFDRDGETITGIETLVRWNHATRGFVSPAFFIPLAERYGLIGRVTRWVLARAMEETRDLGDFTISFNASAVEFADPGFVDELALLIARCAFDPKRLEIEVTETAVLAEEDEVRRNMARLHELGLKIALDDFGVGYSSLSHLRLFPFDKLKIDRAFVTGCAENVQSATLVHAVVSIGAALGMKVVAEGVETEAQRKFLKVAGVHAMQGYLFAKPEPVEALRARLAVLREPESISA